MSEILLDGTGKGFTAKIDSTNKLSVRGVNTSELEEESVFGNGYIISSGFVGFTSANESAILYYKHEGLQPLRIDRFLVSARDSTGGTTNHYIAAIYKNPTGLGSGSGTSVTPSNTNFASSNTLENTSEIGQEGATITGGSLYGGFVLPVENLIVEDANLVLQKGNSIAFSITPPSGNTLFTVGLGMNAHLISI